MSSIYVILTIYLTISIPIFYLIYGASQLVIDEEFHLRQGRHYCEGNFSVWDPKITTFPGLYIASAAFLLPLKICSTFALRLTSLISSALNVILIHEIRKHVLQKRQVNTIKIAVETLVLSILPPMYLFAHLYYTDILSITTVLGILLFNLKQKHNIAAIFGFASVLMRQTNIVWVGMALGCTVMDKVISQTLPFIKEKEKEKRSTNSYTFKDIFDVLAFYCKRFYLVPKQIRLLFVYLIGYISVIVSFIGFVIVNGSIVVGDKSAHEAAIHLPQIFYFGFFFIFFGPSVAFTHVEATFRTLRNRWYYIPLVIVLFGAIIYANTIVHPYLLADNRHYTFYVWNKFYGRYWWGRYAIIPVYIVSLITIYHSISVRSAGFQLIFSICTFAAIALQQLIEIRYFILPYLIVRLSTGPIKFRWLLLEFILYLVLNAIAIYIFTTKEIRWENYDFVQRMIW